MTLPKYWRWTQDKAWTNIDQRDIGKAINSNSMLFGWLFAASVPSGRFLFLFLDLRILQTLIYLDLTVYSKHDDYPIDKRFHCFYWLESILRHWVAYSSLPCSRSNTTPAAFQAVSRKASPQFSYGMRFETENLTVGAAAVWRPGCPYDR